MLPGDNSWDYVAWHR